MLAIAITLIETPQLRNRFTLLQRTHQPTFWIAAVSHNVTCLKGNWTYQLVQSNNIEGKCG